MRSVSNTFIFHFQFSTEFRFPLNSALCILHSAFFVFRVLRSTFLLFTALCVLHRHFPFSTFNFQLNSAEFRFRFVEANPGCAKNAHPDENLKNYSRISLTTPEPTVLPPSRIAKRRPFSIAIGVMSSTVMSTWSPGLHISTPSGRVITPVTSVVLK